MCASSGALNLFYRKLCIEDEVVLRYAVVALTLSLQSLRSCAGG
jgi:hypothetical protein